jgi:hypothetical protein
MEQKAVVLERMMRKIKIGSSGCWDWQGAKWGTNGYGCVCFKRQSWLAHRIMFLLKKGKIKNGNVIMHKCDNRICVNPEHLEQGTQLDNMRDCSNKKRFNSRKALLPPEKLAGLSVSKEFADKVRAIAQGHGIGIRDFTEGVISTALENKMIATVRKRNRTRYAYSEEIVSVKL